MFGYWGKIYEFAESKGLTQEKLAELSHIFVKHILKIELGKVNLKMETFVNLANALDMATNTLLRNYVTHSENISVIEIKLEMKHIYS
ncbi:MAG: helix-turn-helix domain-containing protein [Eubacteriales bacterium]